MAFDKSMQTCVCKKGYYEYFEQKSGEDKKRVCKYCGDINRHDGVDCSTKGIALANLPLKDGFWRSDTDSSNIVECENHASCTNSTNEICAEGHRGPICSVCKEDYIKNAVGFCERCSSAGISISFYVFCFILASLALYFGLRRALGKETRLTTASLTDEISKASVDDEYWIKKYKTKGKILTSFYQIISKLPSTLSNKYPDVYTVFSTAVSSVFDFNAIGLVSVGYFMPSSLYSFYGSFLVATVTPIVISLLILVVTLAQRQNLDPYAKNKLTSSRYSIFFGFTYLIFSSTSTLAFTTFLCKRYGDDDTRWLIADRSVDCDSVSHKRFKILSCLMVLIYPIGITALYSFELWKHREGIKDAKNRDSNMKIRHIVFLWLDYRPEFWRFEIYECFRRLSFTGMLVFFGPGSAPQLCVSIILAMISLQVYTEMKPFTDPEENYLAQISSISIFFTLLAAILITLQGNLSEEHNDKLGVILIFINTLVFAMVGTGILIKPLFKVLEVRRYKGGELAS